MKIIFFSSLSSIGENACNSIVRTHGAVEALVSLVTVEAQSYGPKVIFDNFPILFLNPNYPKDFYLEEFS